MDGGFSGAKMDRPGIQKVIRDAKAKRITKVVVYKLDRLSRSQKDTLYLIEDVFIANGVDFVSMTESLDTATPFGIAMIGILSVFAQLERETIKERMMLGRDAMVKTGKPFLTGKLPIGYKRGTDGGYAIDEYEASVVRSVYSQFIQGESVHGIAKNLTDINFRGRDNWACTEIKNMLTMPTYIGKRKWKGEIYDIQGMPCIISTDMWNAKEKEMNRRDFKNTRAQSRGKHVTLLGGMMWCGVCGRRYASYKFIENGKSVYRDYCLSKGNRMRGHHNPCGNIGWRDDVLNEVVLNQIRKLKTDRPISGNTNTSRIAEERSAIEERIRVLNTQSDRLIELYTLGTLNVDQIKKKSDAIRAETEALEDQLVNLQTPKGFLTPDQLTHQIETFSDLIGVAESSGDYLILTEVVHQLIQSVTIDGETVRIQWNF